MLTATVNLGAAVNVTASVSDSLAEEWIFLFSFRNVLDLLREFVFLMLQRTKMLILITSFCGISKFFQNM